MGESTGRGSIEIDAPPEHVYATITDFATVAEWQSACVSANVEERDADGRAVVVQLQLDMKIKQPKYRNRYTHQPPRRLGFEMIDGDLKSGKGAYTFEDLGDGRTR